MQRAREAETKYLFFLASLVWLALLLWQLQPSSNIATLREVVTIPLMIFKLNHLHILVLVIVKLSLLVPTSKWSDYTTCYLNLLASLSDSSRVRMSPSRTGPFTLRMIERLESSRNSTRTWVHCPWEPVRPRTLVHCKATREMQNLLMNTIWELWNTVGNKTTSEYKIY